MAKFQTLKITSTKIGTTHGTKVEVDGHEITGIRSIELNGHHDDAWRCIIDFLPGALDVEIEALVQRAPDIQISGSFFPPDPGPWPAWKIAEHFRVPLDAPETVLAPDVLDIGKLPEGS